MSEKKNQIEAKQENQLAPTINADRDHQVKLQHLNQKIGSIKALNGVQKLLTVSTLQMLVNIKESKEYKGFSYFKDEKLLTVSSFEEFCSYLGFSRQKIDQDILHLREFGADALEAMQEVGLGYRELARVRKLDEDDQNVVIETVKNNIEDKDLILNLINDLCKKHEFEKEQLNLSLKEMSAELMDEKQYLHEANEQIIQLDNKSKPLHQDNKKNNTIQLKTKSLAMTEMVHLLTEELVKSTNLLNNGGDTRDPNELDMRYSVIANAANNMLALTISAHKKIKEKLGDEMLNATWLDSDYLNNKELERFYLQYEDMNEIFARRINELSQTEPSDLTIKRKRAYKKRR